MEASTWISLILGGWGAVVSTILGINEIRSYSKQLKLILELSAFYETYKLILINESKRPIIIRGISIQMKNGEPPVPQKVFLSEDTDYGDLFPITIKPYESRQIRLSNLLSYQEEDSFDLTVYDIEGKSYTKFFRQTYNTKWGNVEKV